MKGVGRPPIVRPVDMGFPSGIMWAPCNVDARLAGGFAESPYQALTSYVSWGNTVCYEPDSSLHFDYDWGTSNDGPYSETPGSTIGYPGSIPIESDVAHVVCGRSWRMPTAAEFTELLENTAFIDENGYVLPDDQQDKIITMNDVKGVRLRSLINGAAIFIPCCGRSEQNIVRGQSTLYYWSSGLASANSAKALAITGDTVNPEISFARYHGLVIRPVWDPSI